MRFSTRFIATIIGALALCGLFFHGANAQTFVTSGSHSHGVTKGILVPAGTSNPTKQSTIAVSHSSAQSLSKGVRTLHPGSSSNASQGNHSPTAASLALDAGHAGKLLSNFNGVSSLDSAVTNFGLQFQPPDQGLCVGNGFVLEAVNSAYTIYRRDGSVVAGPFNVNVLFNEGLAEFTSDPRCYFDKSTNTWFAIILFISADNTNARTDLAVNTSGDPTTPWTIYHIDATDDGTNGTPSHSGCPCFGDQPRLGIDQENIYISTDEFSILGPQFNGAQIYAVSKPELVALSNSIHFVHFENLSSGGALALSIQPAITTGTSDAEYFLNSIDPFGTFNNRLGVWAVTDEDAVTEGGTPKLSQIVIISEPYGVPPPAIQQGSANPLDSGDDRMQQVQFINGDIWGELDTALTIPNDTAPRAGAAWFRVHPHLNGDMISGASIKNQGYIASLGNYLLYPALQVNHAGTVAVVMTLSGSTFFPSVVYTIMQKGQTSFGTIHIAADGTGPYHHSSSGNRWGDYSWATLDPNGENFWMATEYIPPLSSQTPDRINNWGTRVVEVSG